MSTVLDEVDAVEPAPDILSVIAGARPAFLLSLDIGTSGVRAALFDDEGCEILGAQVRFQRNLASFSDLGVLDADATVAQVIETLDELLSSRIEHTDGIRFIAVSCFWHSLIGVDQDVRPTTHLLGWADTRAAQSANFLRTQFDERECHQRTGCRFHSSYWPAKLHWLRKEQPAVFHATKQWLGFSEYLSQRLFASTATSVSMASATGLLDQWTCTWDAELIDALDISEESLPEIAGSTEQPHLRPEFVERWPALSEARLLTVVGDGAANNIGGACCTKDHLALMVGTSGAMRVVYEGNPPQNLPSELWSYRADRTRVAVGGALSDGGGLYRWFSDLMCLGHDPDDLENQLAMLEPDGHGLTILPFWSGERSTGWSASASGTVFGLTQNTKPVEIVRAAMESVAYRFALIARALEVVNGEATIVATGNALRSSPVWLQIIADVLGKPITLSGTREASTRGAALLALEALGKIESIEQEPVEIDQVVRPDMSRHSSYLEGLARQNRMYELVVKQKIGQTE
jgi:gluconokinase